MQIKCHTITDAHVTSGIPGVRLGLFDRDLVQCVSLCMLGIHEDKDKSHIIGDRGWETIPIYKEETTVKNVSMNACLVLVDLNIWIPCTDKEDDSIILDIFQDGFGILYCPSASTLLSCQKYQSIFTVTPGGLPVVGTLQDKVKVPSKISDVSCIKTDIPVIPKKPGLRALSEYLRTGGNLASLRAYLPDQSSPDQDTSQDESAESP